MELKPATTFQASALLFDMDGTLVDSTAIVEKIWRRFALRYQLDAERILADSHGRRTEETVAMFAPAGCNIAQEAARITAEEIADTEGIVAIPGAADFLAAIPDNRWALVTSASRALASGRMRAAGLPLPDVMICAEDVSRGKPHPQGYLAAAKALKVSPGECIGFEDAEAGFRAVQAAGVRLLAMATTETDLHDLTWLRDFTRLSLTLRADNRLQLQCL